MSRYQAGSVIYGLDPVIPLQRIALTLPLIKILSQEGICFLAF
jgi:hypothetical protein